MNKTRWSVTIVSMSLVLFVFADRLVAEQIIVGKFSESGLNGWQEKSFKGHTDYQVIRANNSRVVEATSHGAASGLVHKISFSPYQYPLLRWSWKVAETIPKGDERTKSGDDYAARVYVVFAGKYFWQTKAINYIWANTLPKEEVIANAFTSNAMMVAVQSGNENAGKWIWEERDLVADYQQLFGTDPGQATAIAIMTDTDNTGGSITAWYGDITLSSRQKSPVEGDKSTKLSAD